MLEEIILEILKDLKWWATDVVFTDYCTSYKNLRRYIYRGRPSPSKEEIKAEQQRKERQRFYNLLSRLKKQGFIKKIKNDRKKTLWGLTSNGLRYLKILKKDKKFLFSLKPQTEEKKDYLKVIVFDIPEIQKKKRNWLRNTLANFNFSMLQKSVWIGETQLPEDFLNSLKELDLLPYIHIFAVSKEGSLNLNL